MLQWISAWAVQPEAKTRNTKGPSREGKVSLWVFLASNGTCWSTKYLTRVKATLNKLQMSGSRCWSVQMIWFPLGAYLCLVQHLLACCAYPSLYSCHIHRISCVCCTWNWCYSIFCDVRQWMQFLISNFLTSDVRCLSKPVCMALKWNWALCRRMGYNVRELKYIYAVKMLVTHLHIRNSVLVFVHRQVGFRH